MVDLHPSEPGLPEGHGWVRVSRWGMFWRVTLASLLVGMLGALLLGLLDFGNAQGVSPFHESLGLMFGVFPAPLFGALAALVGPSLRRFFPFTQGILFGLLGVVVCGIALALTLLVSDFLQGCAVGAFCFDPRQTVWVLPILMFAGLPLAIMAGAGLGTAILFSNSRRAARSFFVILTVTALVFVTVQLLSGSQSRSGSGVVAEDPGPVCVAFDSEGNEVEIPCGHGPEAWETVREQESLPVPE